MTTDQILKKAVNAHQEGKLEEAEHLYREILKSEPTQVDTHNNFGVLLYLTGRLDEAEKSYKKAIELKPEYAEAHNNLGNLQKDLGRLDEAEKSYKKAINFKPDYANAHFNLGNSLGNFGQFEKAEASFKKAIELKPSYFEAKMNLGIIQYQLGKADVAEASFKNAIELKPDYSEAHYYLGNLQKKMRRLEEAETSYNKAIELKPEYAEAHNNLGNLQKDLGRLEEAEITYKKAIEIKADYPEAYSNLGITLKDLGRFEESEINHRKAIELRPNYELAHYNFGIMLFAIKQFKKAADEFKLCNYKDSKKYLMKCFFEINDQSNFNKLLDEEINQGTNNAVIGAFVSLSNSRYETHKQNPFCNEPLDYVIKTDLTKKCDFNKIFIQTAKKILNDKTIINKDQSLLINGIQTPGNLFLQKNDITEKMKDIIYLEIENYREKFQDSKEGFLKNWPKSYKITGWLISMKSGGKLNPHFHDFGWLSGSIYINVPPKKKTDSGNLVVCVDDIKDDKKSKKSIDVVTGSFCLFPASLTHYTIPFESDEERIVLAFDVMPND